MRLWLTKFNICGDETTNRMLLKYHNLSFAEMTHIQYDLRILLDLETAKNKKWVNKQID